MSGSRTSGRPSLGWRGGIAIGLIVIGSVVHRPAGSSFAAEPPSPEDLAFFESKIRPLLLAKCVDCHGADLAESELRLDQLSGMLGGGVSGPAVVPGKVDESLLLSAISYKDEALQMPPDEKLADAEIALLKDWIARGAPHPEADGVAMPAPRKSAIDLEQAKQYWSFKPIRRPELPAVSNPEWVINPIDQFILAGLESRGLVPARPVDKRTLIRRVTYDLTGLPPTPEAVDAFLADESPVAYARVIDRLLDSKEYGEHWGRHWLDIARYADSNGLDENVAHGNAWRYRDYVIRSLNDDKPLDQFIVEQIAGDLLAKQELERLAAADPAIAAASDPATVAVTPQIADLRIATGFLTLGPKVLAEADKVKMRMDIIDEQIDTIGKAFLGMTFGCARCHDHKFDPISAADYYAMAGILSSTETMETLKTVAKWHENPIPTAELLATRRRHQAQIDELKARIDAKFAGGVAVLKADDSAKAAAAAAAATAAAAEASRAAEAAAAAAKAAADKAETAKAAVDAAKAAAPAGDLTAKPSAAFSPAVAAPAVPTATANAQLANAQVAAEPAEPAEKPEDLEAKFPEALRTELTQLREQLKQLEKELPAIPTAMGVRDAAEIADQRIHVRGSHLTLGVSVPRGVPQVLAAAEPIVMPTDASGRLELARWLVSPENPLTARVMVNRVWRWHFGRGLSGSTDNFGLLGEPPTHPELLDWLASEWPRMGWSMKSLHRLILLSNTYQLSSEAVEPNLAIDPDNRYRWRADVRRLQAESIRDGLLAASGLIDGSMGGSMLHVGNHEFIFNHTSKDDTSYATYRRSIYLPVIRNNLYDGFSLFDYSTADVVNGDRDTSTVAPQALFMLNSELVLETSAALADRLLREEPVDDFKRVVRLYQLTLSRIPETEEAEALIRFIAAFENSAAETAVAAAAAPAGEVTPSEAAPGAATAEAASPVAAKPDPRREAWVAACQGLLVSNEFHYVH